jgi:YesN/AraC family two-component response regulator
MNLTELKEYTKDISILYIEDDKDVREQTYDFLENFFKSVTVATDGLEGIEKFKESKVDIIITDINMPNLNGINMIKEIKKIDQDTPIIVTSAYSSSEYLIPQINIGVDRFLLKPFDRKLFISILYKMSRLVKGMQKEKKEKEEKEAYNNKIKNILEIVDNGIIMLKYNSVEYANKAALNMLQVKSIIGIENSLNNLKEISQNIDGYLYAQNIADLISTIKDSNLYHKIIINTPTGKSTFVITLKSLDEDASSIISLNDVTAIDNYEKYDIHTNLPNQAYLLEEIDKYIKDEKEFSIILIYIDNFNDITKWHGKSSATLVEKESANILKTEISNLHLDSSLFLSSIGKNQFVLLSDHDDFEQIEKIISPLENHASVKEESSSEYKKEIRIEPNIKKLKIPEELVANEIIELIDQEFEKLTV